MTPKADESTDKAFRAYRSQVNRIRTELATMTKRMRDLSAFLECDDKRTRRQKKDMGKMLEKLAMSLNKHYLSFAGRWMPDEKLFETGGYLAALSKVGKLESEPLISPGCNAVAVFIRQTVFVREQYSSFSI
jgi:hypothetical protein